MSYCLERGIWQGKSERARERKAGAQKKTLSDDQDVEFFSFFFPPPTSKPLFFFLQQQPCSRFAASAPALRCRPLPLARRSGPARKQQHQRVDEQQLQQQHQPLSSPPAASSSSSDDSAAAAAAAPAPPAKATAPPPPAKQQKGAKLIPLAASVGIGLALRFLVPVPAGLEPQAWSLLSVFVSTIAGLVLEPLPTGAWATTRATPATATRTKAS